MKSVSYNINVKNHKTKLSPVYNSEHMSEKDDISTPIDDRFYRLVNRVPVRCTLSEYAEAMKDDENRIVGQTMVGELQVSTVFTGIDQNWGGNAPILFETVVFGLPDDLRPQWSLSTWDEAMEVHNMLVTMLTEHGTEPLLGLIQQKISEQS
jgi:hypothetical protein